MAQTLTSGQGIDRRQAIALGAAAAAGMLVAAQGQAQAQEAVPAEGDVVTIGDIKVFPYEHFRTGGSDGPAHAVIIFENANSTFTKYQVAITSCTCRDAAYNYRSVMYAELDNTAANPDDAIIRWLTFGVDGDYTVGLWGDSSPIPTNPDYTSAYIDEHLIQPLVGRTKAEIDSWGGYGTVPPGVEIDAVTGATVTCSNISSVLQALFAYHAAPYSGA